jgi:hypothetical protein
MNLKYKKAPTSINPNPNTTKNIPTPMNMGSSGDSGEICGKNIGAKRNAVIVKPTKSAPPIARMPDRILNPNSLP